MVRTQSAEAASRLRRVKSWQAAGDVILGRKLKARA